MKLSVSNIAWEQNALEEHLQLLRDLECDGVEIAPSCIWKEPVEAGREEINDLKARVAGHGLSIPAFHALLFTRPDLYLFGDRGIREQTVAYLKQLIRLAGLLSVPVLVYGSPASRRVGNRQYEQCYGIAVEVFRELGTEAALHDTFFCIEPLGPAENDFIRTADEAVKLIDDVAEPHFGLHLDARAMADASEDTQTVFRKYARIMKHFHVGDPGLAPPGFTGFDHALTGSALQSSGYDRFVSIEMKRGFGNSIKVIADAVSYVRQCYFKAGM
jgi:D-psicose/D-tagatose/L-ribulose 3-epimerase